MGANIWRGEQEWPLARTNFTKFYFHSSGRANTLEGDGVLNTEPPPAESPDSYVVGKGHKLCVEVSSSCFNKYDRNPNTGESFGMATKTICAVQTIHHSKEHPSHITLPVIG